MTKSKVKVKVIKKGSSETVEKQGSGAIRSKRAAARKMVNTVSTWVSDFQARKRDETKLALEQLFSSRTQPNES